MKIERKSVLVNRQIIINKDDGEISVMIADKDCLYWQSPVYISDEEAIACVSGILAGSFAVVGKRIETSTHIRNED